jgi:choline dehydrogenase-like flavoprotein
LANESGLVGRNLMDSVGTTLAAQFPALEAMPPRHDDGLGGGGASHIYVPWWGYRQQARKELDFPRGYHIELGGGRGMPGAIFMPDFAEDSERAYGAAMRDEIRRKYGSYYYFSGRGEMIPNERCFCEIDPEVKDRWGIPVLRFHWQWGEHELRQATHMRQTFSQITQQLGGRVLETSRYGGDRLLSAGGEIIHEVGTTRMGFTPKDSVVNQFGQSWSVKNLFVMDGGIFASNPDKNPTLSILALSWRSSVYLAEEARKGNL